MYNINKVCTPFLHEISFYEIPMTCTCRGLGELVAESAGVGVVTSGTAFGCCDPQLEVKLTKEFQLLLALLVRVLHRLLVP